MRWTSRIASSAAFLAAAVAVNFIGTPNSSAEDLNAGQDYQRPAYLQIGTTAPAVPSGEQQEEQQTPLMSLLDKTPIGPALEKAGIRAYGWIEGSYEYNFMRPYNDANNAHTFDFFQANKAYLNQIDLNLERVTNYSSTQFDVGGHLEMMYGSDAYFTHSFGLLDHENGANPLNPFGAVIAGKSVTFRPGGLYAFDLLQAYVDVAVPVGNGLRVRVGKFEFFKPIDPNNRLTYSTTFAYFAVFPLTLTGITGSYQIADNLHVEAGISRGWNASVKDNNGAIDGLGRVTWDISPRQVMTASIIAGPELPHDNTHWTTVLDGTYSHRLTDELTLLFDGFYGYQAHPLIGTAPGSPVPANPAIVPNPPRSRADFYGVSGDAIYRVNEMISFVGRLEWFRDDGGYTTGQTQNLYEVTIGATIRPFYQDPIGSNLKIRPEIRYDYSSGRAPEFFSTGFGSLRRDQVLFAVDAIFNF